LQLAALGVGTIGLIDGDAVELSNLHRQIIYRTADVGRAKVEVAAARLAAANPGVVLRTFAEHLTAGNLPRVFADFDFVVDATDRVEAKFLVNDGAVARGLPFSHAGVVGLQAQTFTVLPHKTACLRCLFPQPPPEEDMPTCQTAGVLGPLVGTIGTIQAAEAAKHLLRAGNLLADRLLTCDASTQRWRCIALARNPRCRTC
jgi:adenylyltransferase/sulfurtransferase